jgi:hypothetical protein
MRKLLIIFAALFLLRGFALPVDMFPGDTQESMMKNYLTMKGGKMMMVINGSQVLMDSDMSLSNGTVVMKDGTYLLKDGNTMRMIEGEKMDLNGNMFRGNDLPKY